jgi:hypothetical protein
MANPTTTTKEQPRTCWDQLLDETVTFKAPKLRRKTRKVDRYAEQRKRKPAWKSWDHLLDDAL